MATFNLEELWQKEIKILDEIDRICKKCEIQYYIMWGTLIGAVRHKGFIPWDDDIDICMPRKDYAKFLRIAKKELTSEYFLQTPKSDRWHPTYFAKLRLNNTAFYSEFDGNLRKHHGIFVDIFPLDSCKKKVGFISKVKRRMFNSLQLYIYEKKQGGKITKNKAFKFLPMSLLIKIREWAMKGKGNYYISDGFKFEKTDFYPATELSFMDKNYPVPRDYDKVLTTVYGDYMQLPPEDKRVSHSPAFISYDLEKDKEEFKIFLESVNV